MGLFSLSKTKVRYAVIVDIGSGSVLCAIIASDPDKTHPEIIWSKREHSPLRKINSISDSAKSVMTSLINSLMALDSEGRKVFKEKTGYTKLPFLQVSIAAPWSYTATKTISYQHNEDFEVSDTLVTELLRTAAQKVQEEMLENERVHELGLRVIAKTTMQIVANGYPIVVTGKQQASTLKVIQASAVAQEYLIEAIADTQDKMLPDTQLTQYSFMLPFYFVMRDIESSISEYCLVDITYEATEIGIVRDGVLNYCTHVPYGSFSLARDIATVLSVPLEEAFGYLNNEDVTEFLTAYSAEQNTKVLEIIESYQTKLADLFKETGDSLAIPKRIYLHGNLKTEPFFNKRIIAAASEATKMQHAAYNVTKEILTKTYSPEETKALSEANQDTALLISAQFFHTHGQSADFEYL